MTPTCKTCRHWGEPRDVQWDNRKSVLAPCHAINHPSNPSNKNDSMWAGDFGAEMNAIRTGPDFGCIHHEARPA